VAIAAATKVPRAPLITVATFTAHVVASAAVYAWLGLFANDAIGYDQTAVEIARRAGGDASATVQTSSGKEGWVWTLGYIYHWFGHQPILGLILNAALAAAVVPVVGLACDRLGWTFAASRAMWIVGFAPPLFIWSSFLLREPAINLTASVAFAACTLYLSTRRYRWLMLAAAADLLLVWLRGPVAVILLVGLILGVVLVGHLGASRIHPARAIAVVAVAVVAVPLALKLLGTFNASLANINQSRVALARSATTSFGTVSSSSTILGSAWLSIKQLPLAALGPFPWQWSGGFGGLLTAADALTWLAFSWFGIRAWRSQVVRRGRWMCVAPAGVLLLSIALISGNYGTLVRIRAMALPLLASLIAVGMALPRTSRKRVADIQPSVANSPRPAGLRQ
jgi:hypothetical protein